VIATLLAAGMLVAGCGSEPESGPGESSGATTEDVCEALPSSTASLTAELGPSLQEAMDESLVEVYSPGFATAVVVPGTGTWYGASGKAHNISGEPMTTAAGFRIGSITKTFTAAAVLQLVDEGAWSLQDPVTDYVDTWDFPPEVTLERLMNHTSGIFNYTDDTAFLKMAMSVSPPEDVVDFALEHDWTDEPGVAYSYSNTGFFLLGLALESIEDKPYEQIMRDRFLVPYGLTRTYLEQYEEGHCPVVEGHVAKGPTSEVEFSMSWAWAAGGLVSTVDDLCVWAEHLVRGDVLSPASRELMRTPGKVSRGTSRYGLGLGWHKRGGRDVLGHTGSTMGFNGELRIDPDTGICVAVQTNDFLGEAAPAAIAVWDVLATAGY